MTQLRLNFGGNYVLHYPAEPDLSVDVLPFKPPRYGKNGKEKKGASPLTLRIAYNRVETYYGQPESLPTLKYAGYRSLANSSMLSSRQKRMSSARREAAVRVLKVLIRNYDLATKRVGYYDNENTFMYPSVDWIAAKARITPLRCQRVLSNLASAGFLKTTRRIEKQPDGSVKGFNSARMLNDAFFWSLGILPHDLKRAQNFASERMTRRLALKNAGATAEALNDYSRKQQRQKDAQSGQQGLTLVQGEKPKRLVTDALIEEYAQKIIDGGLHDNRTDALKDARFFLGVK